MLEVVIPPSSPGLVPGEPGELMCKGPQKDDPNIFQRSKARPFPPPGPRSERRSDHRTIVPRGEVKRPVMTGRPCLVGSASAPMM